MRGLYSFLAVVNAALGILNALLGNLGVSLLNCAAAAMMAVVVFHFRGDA